MKAGYNVLIPDSSRDMLPQLALPAMDALQQLGHTPVALSMGSMSGMYRDLRLNKHGGYELFLFYVKDIVAKGDVDFALSFGLSGVLEDPGKAELHYLPEEAAVPGLLYMHSRTLDCVDKLVAADAPFWRYTSICTSTVGLAERMQEAGIAAVRHMPHAYSPRIYYQASAVPADAAYPLQLDDQRLAAGYQVSFAGSCTPQRAAWLAPLLAAGIELAVFGDDGWQASEVAPAFRGPVNRLTGLNTVYNSSAVNLDLPMSGEPVEGQPDYVSPRVVECLASGAFLLAADQPGLAQYATPGRELALCQPEDLLPAVQHWLGDSAGRAEHAEAGRARVEAEAQWTTRLRAALGWLEIALLSS
jgi:hypothetical protein